MNSEDEAKDFLEELGLRIECFSKEEQRVGKTPDFKLYLEGDFAFFCEVKESEQNEREGAFNDPAFNRLTAHIHKACKQFKSVNPNHSELNVLLIKNNDRLCEFNDLIGIITGNIYCTDGTHSKIYGNYSDGRMKDDLEEIDLIIWLDQYNPKQFFFVSNDEATRTKLAGYLNCDLSKFTELVT
jgi:hypothetical protein